MSPVLVLAHAPHAESIAQRIKARLNALGYTVAHGATATRRGQAAKIEAAGKVVLLWSRAARGTPALRAAARRARTKGTLVCVSLDAAPPPAGAKCAARLPRSDVAWRRLLSTARVAEPTPARAHPRPAKARRDPRLRVDAVTQPSPRPRRRALPMLVFALALAGAAMTELYAQDAAFAAQVDALASQARTTAVQVVAELGG